MTDTVGLLGLIGTWIAAGCAIVALVAVLPLYFLYKTTRTQRYIALHDVDDPEGIYVYGGIPLLKGKRFFQRVKAPDLCTCPNFSSLILTPNVSVTKRIASLTGWINFGNVVKAYGIKVDTGDFLKYEMNRSFLPVHRGWLLLIGLAGRYADRADYGIKQKSEIEAEMIMFGKKALAGMTGMLCVIPKGLKDLITGDDVDRICFRMHSQAQIQTFLSDDIPLGTLFYLFLGLLPSKGGEQLFDLRVPTTVHTRDTPGDFDSSPPVKPNDPIRGKQVLWKITSESSTSASLWRKRIAFDVKLELPAIVKLKETTHEQLPQKESQKEWSNSGDFYYLKSQESKTIWMLKSEVYAIVHAFLSLSTSPQGFLLGNDLKGTSGLLDDIIVTNSWVNLLQLCNKVIDHMEVPPTKKSHLADVLKKAESEALAKGSTRELWSRGAMAAFSLLDSALDDVVISSSLAMQAIAILHTLSPEFRTLIDNEEYIFEQGSTSTFRFDLDGNSITVQGLDEDGNTKSVEFPFDFKPLLGANLRRSEKATTEKGEAVLLKYPTVLLGCLFSQLRGTMWNMMLPGSDLLTMYNQLGRVVQVSAISIPPSTGEWLDLVENISEQLKKKKTRRSSVVVIEKGHQTHRRVRSRQRSRQRSREPSREPSDSWSSAEPSREPSEEWTSAEQKTDLWKSND